MDHSDDISDDPLHSASSSNSDISSESDTDVDNNDVEFNIDSDTEAETETESEQQQQQQQNVEDEGNGDNEIALHFLMDNKNLNVIQKQQQKKKRKHRFQYGEPMCYPKPIPGYYISQLDPIRTVERPTTTIKHERKYDRYAMWAQRCLRHQEEEDEIRCREKKIFAEQKTTTNC